MITAIKNNFSSIFAPSTGHIKCIDGIRALSIIMVMVGHLHFYASLSGSLPKESIFVNLALIKGWFGVDSFFTISGFLIGSIVFKAFNENSFSYKTFIQRRFLRLAPAYYFTLLALLLLPSLPLLSNDKGNALLNFFYISNFAPLLEQFMTWSWSLCVEEQFYVVFPLVVMFLYRFRSNLILPVLFISFPAVLSLFFFYCSIYNINPFDSSLEGYLSFVNHIYGKTIFRAPSIISGLIVAYIYINNYQLRHFAESSKKVIWLPVIGLIIILLPVTDSFYTPSVLAHFLSHIFVPFFISIIIFYMLFCEKVFLNKFLSRNFWLPTARVSYSLYLTHPIIFSLFLDQYTKSHFDTSDLHLTLLFITMLVSSTILAVALHVIVEKPFMNIRKKSASNIC